MRDWTVLDKIQKEKQVKILSFVLCRIAQYYVLNKLEALRYAP